MPFLTTALVAGGLAAAGSIGGAAIAGSAAGHAADTQAQAAEYAAQLQKQEADAALAFQKQEFSTQQANEAPFLKAGQGAIGDLSSLLNNGGFPDYNQTFTAPTAAQAEATPGYQFQLQQGEQALARSAAASGDLLSGGQLKAQDEFAQGLASTNYQNAYNNALQTFGTNYNVFQQNQANRFNRLASVAGIGQTSAGQLGAQGQGAANNISNLLLTSGQQIGNNINNAAAATASGYIGSANAYGGALSSIGNNIGQYALLNGLLNQGGAGAIPDQPPDFYAGLGG